MSRICPLASLRAGAIWAIISMVDVAVKKTSQAERILIHWCILMPPFIAQGLLHVFNMISICPRRCLQHAIACMLPFCYLASSRSTCRSLRLISSVTEGSDDGVTCCILSLKGGTITYRYTYTWCRCLSLMAKKNAFWIVFVIHLQHSQCKMKLSETWSP